MCLRKSGEIRLYVDESLGEGQEVVLSRDQSHYLFGVMRRAVGDTVLLFNGRDGEWSANILKAGKSGLLGCQARTRVQTALPDIWLVFAPVKRARTDIIVEKAAELGVSRILPVFTAFTNSERVRRDRMVKIAIEAAEQSRGLSLPQIDEGASLDDVLINLAPDRTVIHLDETKEDRDGLSVLSDISGPVALLVGPEGGFSPAEIARLKERDRTVGISLGPRTLRAETAAIAGLALVQATLGDWYDPG